MALIRRSLAAAIVNAPAQRRRAGVDTKAREHSNAIDKASALRVVVFAILYVFLC